MLSSSDDCTRRPFWNRHFFLAVGIPLLVAFKIVFGGYVLSDIALHEARTIATVTGIGSHGIILYRYDIDGHTYSGGGDPGDPPYPEGSTFEIRYSTVHPSFSSAQPFSRFLG